jgi:O-antigen biosynthesis protein
LPSQIDISIIIINYNEEELLKQCLASILKFTENLSYEIIVVDNGSTVGNLVDVIKEYPSVKLVANEKNLGFAAANNIGFKYAHGKYLLLLNNDTKLMNNIVREVFEFTQKFNTPVFAGCQLLNEDLSNQESVSDFPSLLNNFTENFYLYKVFPKSKFFNKYFQNYHEYNEPIEVDVIRGAFMFCDAESFRRLNGFDDRFFFYSEETDLCYRFKKEGNKIYFLPESKIIHYGGATTDKNLWFKYKNQAIGKIQYYQKHFRGLKYSLAILFHFCGLFMRFVQNGIAGVLLFRKELLIKGFYFLKQMSIYPTNKFKN